MPDNALNDDQISTAVTVAFQFPDDPVRNVTALALGVLVVWLLAWFPGHNARRRNHPNAGAVSIAGWLLLLFWIMLRFSGLPAGIVSLVSGFYWLVVVIWSFAGEARPTYSPRSYAQTLSYDAAKVPVTCPHSWYQVL